MPICPTRTRPSVPLVHAHPSHLDTPICSSQPCRENARSQQSIFDIFELMFGIFLAEAGLWMMCELLTLPMECLSSGYMSNAYWSNHNPVTTLSRLFTSPTHPFTLTVPSSCSLNSLSFSFMLSLFLLHSIYIPHTHFRTLVSLSSTSNTPYLALTPFHYLSSLSSSTSFVLSLFPFWLHSTYLLIHFTPLYITLSSLFKSFSCFHSAAVAHSSSSSLSRFLPQI